MNTRMLFRHFDATALAFRVSGADDAADWSIDFHEAAKDSLLEEDQEHEQAPDACKVVPDANLTLAHVHFDQCLRAS